MPLVLSDCKASHCVHQRGSEGLPSARHLCIWTVGDAGTAGAYWSVAVLHKQRWAAHACCLVQNARSLTCEARQPNQLTCLSPPGKCWM